MVDEGMEKGFESYRFFVWLLLFLRGTLPPSRRASLRPMAIACLRLVTFLPSPRT